MDAVETFESLRGTLFSLAYRMLGSVSEVEDVVQEAFLRQQRALSEGAEIESPKAFLSAVVTRLSIDQLRSARARREVYVGEWLPEPLLTEDGPKLDPADHAEQADSLSLAFLVLLEQLTPVERAVPRLRCRPSDAHPPSGRRAVACYGRTAPGKVDYMLRGGATD